MMNTNDSNHSNAHASNGVHPPRPPRRIDGTDRVALRAACIEWALAFAIIAFRTERDGVRGVCVGRVACVSKDHFAVAMTAHGDLSFVPFVSVLDATFIRLVPKKQRGKGRDRDEHDVDAGDDQ